MGQEVATKSNVLPKLSTKEYSLLIDGAIELQSQIDQKMFFDGLFDAVIAYVEQHNALAGLAMSYKEYDYTDAD